MTSRQIGWSQESNLLYEIGKQMDILAKVLANSGKGSLEIYPDLASFPPTGFPSVIYLAEDTGYIYYWDGASYIQFGGGSYVPTSRQLTINGVTFDLSADRTWTISTGDDITVVANYSALPAPNTVSGQFYWCSNPQGTAWLPGSVGGTYYNSGLYYSNGTTWEFLNVPYQATQSEVNAGIISDKFVTPNTLFNSTQWATKQGALTLTTTGTSGAATLVGTTLNIPQYSGGGGMAIGGSITSATAGSVLFAGTSGVLQQDNANLFWDDTNNRLGVGTNAPQNNLDIVRGSAGAMGRSTYETSSFSFNNDIKLGIYTSSSNSIHGAGLIFGQTNLQAGSLYPAFEMQYTYSSTVADNNWRLNYTGRTATGLVSVYAASLFNVYADGRIIINPTTSGVTSTPRVIIGSSTDAGYRLDVNGTARVTDELSVNGINIGRGSGAIASNTRVGTTSLNSNITGNDNVAIGVTALRDNTTGNRNIAIGNQAGLRITTGSQNIAIGVTVLTSNLTGTNNIAIGYNALVYNTNSNHIGIGDESLFNNTSASSNIGIGVQSLYGITTGGSNIALGYRAGRYAGSGTTANQTSNNSIYLGYQSRAGASGNTNEIVIGYNVVGNGSNTSTIGNSSTVATYLGGKTILSASTTSRASLNIVSGTDPTSPNDGDIWFDGTDIKMRIGGVTKTFTLV